MLRPDRFEGTRPHTSPSVPMTDSDLQRTMVGGEPFVRTQTMVRYHNAIRREGASRDRGAVRHRSACELPEGRTG
jgi:hypothetical protein